MSEHVYIYMIEPAARFLHIRHFRRLFLFVEAGILQCLAGSLRLLAEFRSLLKQQSDQTMYVYRTVCRLEAGIVSAVLIDSITGS